MIYRLFLKVYKNSFSFLLETVFGKGCIYNPTCSVYASESLEKYGFLKGSFLSIKRILRCHPLYKGNLYDPLK